MDMVGDEEGQSPTSLPTRTDGQDGENIITQTNKRLQCN